jgi:prolyl-tRNA synthetase
VITLVRRDTGEKFKIQNSKFKVTIEKMLEEIQKNLYQKSLNFLKDNTHEVMDYQEFKKIMSGPRGFIRAFWCGSSECEAKIKQETKATIRAIPLEQAKSALNPPLADGGCIYCGKSPSTQVFFAQAY